VLRSTLLRALGFAALAAAMLAAPALAHASSGSPAATAKAAHRAELEAVSCARATLCMAVGYRATAHGRGPLAEEWNGRSWTSVPIPAPKATDSYLVSVSCAAKSQCTAVGAAATSLTSSGPIAEQWNGRKWRLTQTANPAGVQAGSLTGVSCASRDQCVAVGTSQGVKRDLTLTEKWDGRSWTVARTAKLPRSAGFTGADCAARFCMAVGEQVRATRPGEVTLAEDLTKGSWRQVTTPALTGADLSVLYGVWCASPRFCLAVGQSQGTSTGAIAEEWNGSAWTVQAPSAGSQLLTTGILFGISCSSDDRCMAVGASGSRPVSLLWTGSGWTAEATAHVTHTPFASLYQVSCPTATRCIAVGARTSGGLGDIGTSLAEEWNGTSWSVLRTVNP
jgi:hypothetical protein